MTGYSTVSSIAPAPARAATDMPSIVVGREHRRTLFSANADAQRYPAS
ncbi:hypothetical protein VXQ18_03955 [Brucella abortus]|nr:hypothetical protein [Brucella abortus]